MERTTHLACLLLCVAGYTTAQNVGGQFNLSSLIPQQKDITIFAEILYQYFDVYNEVALGGFTSELRGPSI